MVGFDIVELCPNAKEKSSDFLAAKLYYKMLTYKFLNEDAEDDFDNNFNQLKGNPNKISKFNDDDDNE